MVSSSARSTTFGFAFGRDALEKTLAKRERIAGFDLVPVAGQEGPTDGPADSEGGRSSRRVLRSARRT